MKNTSKTEQLHLRIDPAARAIICREAERRGQTITMLIMRALMRDIPALKKAMLKE